MSNERRVGAAERDKDDLLPSKRNTVCVLDLTRESRPPRPTGAADVGDANWQVEGGLKVGVQFSLLNILEVSTADERFVVQGWWRMKWQDPQLTWDPDQWGGIKRLTFSDDQVWKPDITAYEHVEEQSTPTRIAVSSSGMAVWSVPRVTKMGCTMNLTSYPFDSQFCGMTIGSWAHDGTELQVEPRPVDRGSFWLDRHLQPANGEASAPPHSILDLREYRAQPSSAEFALKSLRVVLRNHVYESYSTEPFPIIELEFELERATLTIFIALLVPIILVTLVGFCTLWMPAPVSGARPALAVTVMLTTATVYLVSSSLTPQSNTMTVLTRLYLVSLANKATR